MQTKKSILLICYFIILLCTMLVVLEPPCCAMQIQLTFDKVIKSSDVIFVGQVTDQQCRYGPNQNMIFTDVCFEVQELMYQSQKAKLSSSNDITLTFAGGQIGERGFSVSDVPSFETGEVYLICTRMDGETYASPIVGAYQGLYRIVKDELTGIDYPLYGSRPISKIIKNKLVFGPAVSGIRGSALQPAAAGKLEPANFLNKEAPQPSAGFKGIRAWISPPPPVPEEIMNLDQFIAEINKRIE